MFRIPGRIVRLLTDAAPHGARTAMAAVLLLPAIASCAAGRRMTSSASPSASSSAPPFVRASGALAGLADSVRTEPIAGGGALLHTIANVRAPWRAYVVEQDLGCASVRALKGGPTAVGRTTTSTLLTSLPADQRAYAAVNADFFLFAPSGVPTNLHVEERVLYTGPGPKPVFAFDGTRQFTIDTIVARGALLRGRDTLLVLTAWNRPGARANGILDARWGVAADTAVRSRLLKLVPAHGAVGTRREGVPFTPEGTYVLAAAAPRDTVASGDTLLLHLTARAWRDRPMRAGDTLQLTMGLATPRGTSLPVHEAVGGRPIVLRDSVITADVETEGNAGFRNLNPRTAVGLDRRGTRAWYAVIDGRQPGYSMGMTLRQVGDLMQALGAAHAINLDGGGSSALAVRDLETGTVRVVNRPSDKTERAVGNALALTAQCRKP